MIFRTINDEFIEIKRYHYKNDKLYYEKIMEIKKEILNKYQSSKSKKALNNKNN